MANLRRVRVLDSHTGGEPTRLVLDGVPDLGSGSVAKRCARFNREHRQFREHVLLEPRGSEILVGAIIVPPDDRSCNHGLIFFNNVGTIGMCGHGTIGIMVSLAHLGRLQPGPVRFETAVGAVTATLLDRTRAVIANVPSYRHAAHVTLDVPGLGRVNGDIAWGGNWFFLTHLPGEPLHRSRVKHLCDLTMRIRRELERNAISGAAGAAIDHIELFEPLGPRRARNFVLCPGLAWDRSPCGTGTSAKLACLAAEGSLAPGETWHQESVTGSVFEASYQWHENNTILPHIIGQAFVTAEATLVFDDDDSLHHHLPTG